MNGKIKFEFEASLWQFMGNGGWHFISLPIELSKEIRSNLKSEEEGWGRMKAVAKIRDSQWETAIWFDTKLNTYLLPVKSTVRKKEKLVAGDTINTLIWI